MQLTILEVLYLVLIIVLLLSTIFFIGFMIEATKVMKSMAKITEKAEEMIHTASELPLLWMHKLVDKMKHKKREGEE